MIYLLIDNCSLRGLIDTFGFSKFISDLENLISSNKIKFVTHELVIQEWEKYKPKWKIDKENKLLGNKKDDTNIESSALVPGNNFLHVDHIQRQIDQIDLFLKNAIALETPDVITNEFSNRYRDKKAPFHNKSDSQNDWEIIGTFCHYSQVNGIKEIYFLSSNKKEFADIINPNLIHVDISTRFSKIIIHYYSDHVTCFNDLRNSNAISIDLIPYTLIPNENFSFKMSLKRTVLDSLCFLYTELYSEITYIPVHILRTLYPFAPSENSHTYYSRFTMGNVSEDMIEFFENVEVDENKEIKFKNESILHVINKYKDKTKYALQMLTSNLVFHISGEKSRKRVCTHYFVSSNCQCCRCSYNRLNISAVFAELDTETTEYKEKLKQAYIHYQLGNFKSANTIYDEIISRALGDGKFISYYIAKYNQHHLANFLDNYFMNNSIDYELVSRLEKIDPLEEAVKLKTFTDYNLLSFMAKSDFFLNALESIKKSVDQIKEHYRNQLYGGWGSNDHVWDLITKFAQLDSFLNENFIIYDGYSNFKKLFEMVLDGLFASYSISTNQGERFEHFDDYWIEKCLMYGDEKAIRNLANRYGLESIKYKPTNSKNDSFIDLFRNLIESEVKHRKVFEKSLDRENLYYKNKIEDLFQNALAIASILNLDKEIIDEFVEVLFLYLNSEPKLKYPSFEAILYFVQKKKKYLCTTSKYKFLAFSMAQDRCWRDNLLFSIVESFQQDEIDNIPEEYFTYLLNEAISICSKCHNTHNSEILGPLHERASGKHKKQIKNEVVKLLSTKFKFDLFYLASLFKIIKFDKNRLIELISNYIPNPNKKSFRSIFSNSIDFQDSFLDSAINLCFAFKVDTTSEVFATVSEMHPYYKWLLNMDGYDYEEFNVEWVLVYGTIHYQKAMARSKNLKNELRKYLLQRSHAGIEQILLKITNFIN